MQLDREGIEDSQETSIDLEAHFLRNGMSSRGYQKIKNDIDNGDMSVDILVKFDENELIIMANEYNLSTLQKKAFVEAVKLLPNSKANAVNNNNKNVNSNHKEKEFVFVTQEEQTILNQMDQLKKELRDYTKQCTNVKNNNKSVILSSIKKLENCGKLIKDCVDNAVNVLVKQV